VILTVFSSPSSVGTASSWNWRRKLLVRCTGMIARIQRGIRSSVSVEFALCLRKYLSILALPMCRSGYHMLSVCTPLKGSTVRSKHPIAIQLAHCHTACPLPHSSPATYSSPAVYSLPTVTQLAHCHTACPPPHSLSIATQLAHCHTARQRYTACQWYTACQLPHSSLIPIPLPFPQTPSFPLQIISVSW
jgi:hypothetical protein